MRRPMVNLMVTAVLLLARGPTAWAQEVDSVELESWSAASKVRGLHDHPRGEAQTFADTLVMPTGPEHLLGLTEEVWHRLAVDQGWLALTRTEIPEPRLLSRSYTQRDQDLVANFCAGRLEALTLHAEVGHAELGSLISRYNDLLGEPTDTSLPSAPLVWRRDGGEIALSVGARGPTIVIVEITTKRTRLNPCLQTSSRQADAR